MANGANSPLTQRQSSGGGLLEAITALTPIFLGSGGSTTRQTTSPKLTQAGMDATLQKLLQSNAGLAAIASGERGTGLYNSSVNQQLINDLLARSAAEVAIAGNPQTTTTVNSGVAPLVSPGMALGGLLLAQAFSKEGLGGMFGGSASPSPTGGINPAATAEGTGPITDIVSKTKDFFGGMFGGAEAAATPVTAASVMAPQLANLPSVGLGDTLNIGNALTPVTDFMGSLGEPAVTSALSKTFGSLEGVGAGQGFDIMGTDAANLGSLPFGAMLNLASGDMNGAVLGGLTYGMGQMLNAIVPGLGFIAAPIFGAMEGSVVCTELYRSGIMPYYLYKKDVEYAHNYMSKTTLRGYRFWGVPLVKLMRKYFWIKKLVAPVAITRARYIARETGFLGTIGGFLIRTIGEPACWVLGNFVKERNLLELYSAEELKNYAYYY